MHSMAAMVQLAEWTGFLAAQLYNAGTAVMAHVPAWLPGVALQHETVWVRRLLLLESFAPVPGLTAAMVGLLVQPYTFPPNVFAHIVCILLAES